MYRVSSIPPKFGEPLASPQCLTCSKDVHDHKAATITTTTSTIPPPRLITSWDDDWEEEPTLLSLTTPLPKRKRSRKESYQKTSPEPCQYHEAAFAPGELGLVLIDCLGPDIPTTAIYRMPAKFDSSHTLWPIYHIQNNTKLRNRIKMVALPQVKYFPVMISGGYHAQVRLFLPPGLREDEITRYPLILHV